MSKNKYQKPSNQMEIYNVRGTIKRTEKTVVMEIDTGGTILKLHFGSPVEMMNFMLLMIDEMAKVFPDFEMSKLWLDENFR